MRAVTLPRSEGLRAIDLAVALAAVGAGALLLLATASRPEEAAASYLAALVTVASATAGALTLAFVGALTGARWWGPIRAPVESLALVAPLVAVLALPTLCAVPRTHPPGMRAAVIARTAGSLVVWTALALLLRRAMRRRERPRALAAAGLILLAYTVTFVAYDLVGELDPHGPSPVLGVLLWTRGFVAALAVACFAPLVASMPDPSRTSPLAHDLGKLLFTAVAFWAYLAYAHVFITWIASLPREVPWLRARLEAGWTPVSAGVILVQLAALAVLLPRGTKRSPVALAAVASVLLAAHAAECFALVKPALEPGARFGLGDLAALSFLTTAVAAAALRGGA